MDWIVSIVVSSLILFLWIVLYLLAWWIDHKFPNFIPSVIFCLFLLIPLFFMTFLTHLIIYQRAL